MKDIDFDELDKAVNSLMGTIKSKPDQPPPKTLTISTTLKENEAPEYTRLQRVAEKIGSETIGIPTERTAVLPASNDSRPPAVNNMAAQPPDPSPVVPADPASTPAMPVATPPQRTAMAPRRSGRFMDVMHRSSDMKPAPSAAPSREAASVTPPVATPPPTPPDVAVPQSQTPPDAAVSGPATPAPEIESVPEPLTSPFLPDAKVEKRPLGGLAPPPDEGATSQSPSSDTYKKDAQLVPGTTDSAEIELPEELNNDLLAIETNLAVDPSDSLESSESAVSPIGSTIPAAPAHLVAPSDPASIPGQHQELPTGGEPVGGGIFDVNDYHKQPAHPAKTGHSGLWIIAIILIIIVCAAGAAAFYLLSAK